jgi:hypothetical protein
MVVAVLAKSMRSQRQPDDVVLEIGTGLGYQSAVLAELAGRVYSVEMIDELAQRAAQRLKRQGYTNVEVRVANGYLGWPEYAPFDKIIVTAARFDPSSPDQSAPGWRKDGDPSRSAWRSATCPGPERPERQGRHERNYAGPVFVARGIRATSIPSVLIKRSQRRKVRVWHKADILVALSNVRFRGQSGHRELRASWLVLTHAIRTQIDRFKKLFRCANFQFGWIFVLKTKNLF